MVEQVNVAIQLMRNFANRNKDLIEEKSNKNDGICAGCNAIFDKESRVYKCRRHKLFYCKGCVTNNGHAQIDHNEVKTCDEKFRTNCIYEVVRGEDLL